MTADEAAEQQQAYEQRRQERLLGLSIHGAIINVQNLITYAGIYSWPGDDEAHKTRTNIVNASNIILTALKVIEEEMLGVNDKIYAPIIPTEDKDKL